MTNSCQVSDELKVKIGLFLDSLEPTDEIHEVIANLNDLNICNIVESEEEEVPRKKSERKKRGGKRKQSKYNIWIGHCMRGKDKGGLERTMKSCAAEYKDKGADKLLEEYNL